MTTNFTQYLNVLCQAFTDYVTDFDTSTWAAQMNSQVRYNVQRRKIEEITLASGSSYQIALPSLATSDWHLLAITCRPAYNSTTGITQAVSAQGYIQTAGYKADNSTAITGYIPMYGALLPSGVYVPGIVFLSTYNLTAAPTIYSLANGSVFTVYESLCVEDGA